MPSFFNPNKTAEGTLTPGATVRPASEAVPTKVEETKVQGGSLAPTLNTGKTFSEFQVELDTIEKEVDAKVAKIHAAISAVKDLLK